MEQDLTLDMIVAVTSNWGIGRDGGMLCSLPEDMAFFRSTTRGAVFIMGRATLDSFPGGHPLKGRVNIVLTRDPGFSREGAVCVHSVEEAVAAAEKARAEKLAADGCAPQIFVIGGDTVYHQLAPYCTGAWVTKMDTLVPADSFFPDLDADDSWVCVEESNASASAKNGVTYRFCRYEHTSPRELH